MVNVDGVHRRCRKCSDDCNRWGALLRAFLLRRLLSRTVGRHDGCELGDCDQRSPQRDGVTVAQPAKPDAVQHACDVWIARPVRVPVGAHASPISPSVTEAACAENGDSPAEMPSWPN